MEMGTLYDVLHDVHTIKSRMLEIIFVNDKNAPETVLRFFYFLLSIQYL